jgi:hypothetical protein
VTRRARWSGGALRLPALADGDAHTALILHAGARNAESRSQTTSRQRASRTGKPLQTAEKMRILSARPR